MATYQQLQTRVGHIVIDQPASVQAQVPTLVNEAIRELQREHDFKVCETELTATTVAGQRSLVSRPANWLKWRSLPYIIGVDGHVNHLEWAASKMAAARDFGLTEGGEADADIISGIPRALIERDASDELGTTTIDVYPLPDGNSLYTNGEYRIVIPYVKTLTVLSASSSQNWFTNNGEQAIAFKAAAMAFFLNWDEEKGTYWTQLAAAEMRKLILLDKKQRLSQVREVVPQHNARGSMLGRRDRFGGRQ